MLPSLKSLSSLLHLPWCWTCNYSGDVRSFSAQINCSDLVSLGGYFFTSGGAREPRLSTDISKRLLSVCERSTCSHVPPAPMTVEKVALAPLVPPSGLEVNIMVGPGLWCNGLLGREQMRGTGSPGLAGEETLELSPSSRVVCGLPFGTAHPERNHCGTHAADSRGKK